MCAEVSVCVCVCVCACVCVCVKGVTMWIAKNRTDEVLVEAAACGANPMLFFVVVVW